MEGKISSAVGRGGTLTGAKLAVGASFLLCVFTAGQAAAASRSAAAGGSFRVTVSSPTHAPKVNAAWPVRVTATDAAGKPLAATLTMQVLFDGTPVGKIDNGAVYHFVGSWQERKGNAITWPAASRGEPLTVEFIVTAQGKTVDKDWSIRVG
jgi:hypothetical protein